MIARANLEWIALERAPSAALVDRLERMLQVLSESGNGFAEPEVRFHRARCLTILGRREEALADAEIGAELAKRSRLERDHLLCKALEARLIGDLDGFDEIIGGLEELKASDEALLAREFFGQALEESGDPSVHGLCGWALESAVDQGYGTAAGRLRILLDEVGAAIQSRSCPSCLQRGGQPVRVGTACPASRVSDSAAERTDRQGDADQRHRQTNPDHGFPRQGSMERLQVEGYERFEEVGKGRWKVYKAYRSSYRSGAEGAGASTPTSPVSWTGSVTRRRRAHASAPQRRAGATPPASRTTRRASAPKSRIPEFVDGPHLRRTRARCVNLPARLPADLPVAAATSRVSCIATSSLKHHARS